MKLLRRSLAILAAFCFLHEGRAQAPQSLPFNQPITVSLKAGQVLSYSIPLKKGQFAAVKVEQKSVGIAYALYAPGDSLLINEDLNALYQTEVIPVAATKSGNYRIDIFWDYGRPQQGDVTILWHLLEPGGKTIPRLAEQYMKGWYPDNEPGAAVLVLKDNKVVFKSTRGLANMDYRIPVTDSSAFELASCSKQFTGFAIAMLIDQGVLSLQDDVRKYLPELPDFGQKITIEHLLYHTSGLRNWDSMSNSMGFETDDALTMDLIYKMICSTSTLNFNPGERFSYTNTGYNLLVLIAERATHQKFDQWMASNIFQPLGMKNSLVRTDLKKVIPNKVSSYQKGLEGFNARADNISAPGSTSVVSTIDDLAKWLVNYETGTAGGRNVLKLLNQKTRLTNGDTLTYYAFGNGFGSRKGVSSVEHLGLVSGFRTIISRYPSQNLAVVFLSSDNNDATYNRCWTLTDLFLSNKKEQALPPVKFPDLSESLAKTMSDQGIQYPVDPKEYEGLYYAEELNMHYKLVIREGVLTAISAKLGNIPLTWQKADYFSGVFQTTERRFLFGRDESKAVYAFRLTGGDKPVLFRKMVESPKL